MKRPEPDGEGEKPRKPRGRRREGDFGAPGSGPGDARGKRGEGPRGGEGRPRPRGEAGSSDRRGPLGEAGSADTPRPRFGPSGSRRGQEPADPGRPRGRFKKGPPRPSSPPRTPPVSLARLQKVAPDDRVTLRKQHPCGGFDWAVTRVGADIGLQCLTCGRRVMVPRDRFQREVRALRPARPEGEADLWADPDSSPPETPEA